MLGHFVSDEARMKMKLAKIGKCRAPFTETHIQSMIEAQKCRKGVSLPKEIKEKIAASVSGQHNHMFGKHHSSDTKKKMRDSTIKRINLLYGKVTPRYNPKACELFEEINTKLNWNGQHAENGGEYFVKELGYWVDYYEPNLNIVIEYDEKEHNRKSQKLRDDLRQKEIEIYLGCKFYRIKQDANWKSVLNVTEF